MEVNFPVIGGKNKNEKTAFSMKNAVGKLGEIRNFLTVTLSYLKVWLLF